MLGAGQLAERHNGVDKKSTSTHKRFTQNGTTSTPELQTVAPSVQGQSAWSSQNEPNKGATHRRVYVHAARNSDQVVRC